MGLDMYLNKRISLMEYTPDPNAITLTGKYPSNQHITKTVSLENVNHLEYEIGYWRKANHIHKWFVDNVQDGKDDCGDYYVSKEKLEELLQVCKQVLEIWQTDNMLTDAKEEKIQELLPTESGFFFGSTAYDEYYIDAIQDTIDIIEKEINSPEWNDKNLYISYTYQSSW